MPQYKYSLSGDVLNTLQQEVFEWSLRNFKDNRGLNHVAPLLGIYEEWSELLDAEDKQEPEAVKDAVADICIFTLDCTARISLPATKIWPHKRYYPKPSLRVVITDLGNIAHSVLKNVQQIRGLKKADSFHARLAPQFTRMLEHAQSFWPDENLYQISRDTFDRIVAKRNWIEEPPK